MFSVGDRVIAVTSWPATGLVRDREYMIMAVDAGKYFSDTFYKLIEYDEGCPEEVSRSAWFEAIYFTSVFGDRAIQVDVEVDL